MSALFVMLGILGVGAVMVANSYRERMMFHAERAEYWYAKYREADKLATDAVNLAGKAIAWDGRQGKEPTADAPMKEGT